MAAASTRTGGSTPAQALGDALATPTGAPGAAPATTSALAAALAAGASPAEALRQAAVASAQLATMTALATAPIAPDAQLAASMGAGVAPSLPATPAAQASAQAYSVALAGGQDPVAAQAAARQAEATLSTMESIADLPATPASQGATSLASGDVQGLGAILGNETTVDPGFSAALSLAMARGASMDDVQKAAQVASNTLTEQRNASLVEVSDNDKRTAQLAAGEVPDDSTSEADSASAAQLANASVPVAQPSLADLATGLLPDASAIADPQMRRLLNVPAGTTADQADDAPLPGSDDWLLRRLAEGRAKPEDVAAFGEGVAPNIFVSRVLRLLALGRSLEAALAEGRSAEEGFARDNVLPPQSVATPGTPLPDAPPNAPL